MFERFTDRSRKVMALSTQEAHRFNSDYVEPQHVMLGLVKEGSGVAANVLKNLNCSLQRLRAEVEKREKISAETVLMGKIPQSKQTKRVIEESVNAARDLNVNYVGTEHILLGLLNVPDTVAQQILADANITADQIKKEVHNLLGTDKVEIDQMVDEKWDKPSWDEYFMLEATTALSRSPDPSTKHGAVIVNARKRPVGQGYNGFPSGGDESIYPTTRPEKYVFIIHAEANAILNCTFPPEGCTLYVTGVPCNNCMKYIIQAGIKRVVYGKIGSSMVDLGELNRTMVMAKNHGVEMVQYNEPISPYQWHLRVAGYLKRKGWT